MNDQRNSETAGSEARQRRYWPVIAACAVAFLLALIGWNRVHWAPSNSWDLGAIRARFTDMTLQTQEREVHLIFRYALTNTTRRSYRIPPPAVGVLMTRVPEGGMHQMESVRWDPVVIPAGKTVNAQFDVALDPLTAEPYPDLSADELQQQGALNEFAQRHLARMRGLVFFDYQKRYSIELPQGWD